MRAANIPMKLVGNGARRRHIQQRKRTLTPKQKKGQHGSNVHGSGNHKRRRRHKILSSHLADDFTAIVSLVSGWRRTMGRSKLQQRYYDPKHVGSYGGVAALRRVVPGQDVERWLLEQDTYTLHKQVRRRSKRRCVVVGGPNQQWQADLVDMSLVKKVNDGTTFILTVIDVFSKLAWCVPLKNKSAASLVAAFTQLLSNGAPNTLQTDKGTEYLNRLLQQLLKKARCASFCDAQRRNEGEHCREDQSHTDDTYVALFHENPVGSIRRRPAGIYAIVHRHLSPQYRYGSVRSDQYQAGNMWQRLYCHESVGTPKFRVGDRVRISKAKRHFEKGIHG